MRKKLDPEQLKEIGRRYEKRMQRQLPKPVFHEPLVYSPEYRALVQSILRAKARRELQEQIDRTGRG